MDTNPIATTLASVTFGPEVSFENLTMIPLVSKHPGTSCTDYVVLDEALASGLVEITEVSEQGSVPDLRVVNKGARPVLIMDGEELVGAKQNRVVNLTILVDAHSELTIPVSCVEAGRWRARSRAFASAPRAQYATGRARRMKHVTDSMCLSGERVSNQADVWADIAQKSVRMKASSPTSAMEALFEHHAAAIDQFVSACTPVDGQVGAIFAVSDRIIGFDLFDRPSTLQKMLPKLVRSVAVDALDAGLPSGSATRARKAHAHAEAERFAAAAGAAPQHVAKAVGLGEDVRFNTQGVIGAALAVDGGVIHVSAFAE